MQKIALGTVIVVTAAVTALLTSAFWLIAFNAGAAPDPVAAGSVPPPAVPAAPASQLSVGPSGLVIPVAGIGPKDLSDTYRQSRAEGARVHNAIDIMAPSGTPVVAATEGVVEKLYFSRGGGGITVYVRSPDRQWIYYYAHLQEYAPGLQEGQNIGRGDRIGTVGSTGNASPSGPHLHFAIHRMEADEPWYEGEAINPYPLLAGSVPPR